MTSFASHIAISRSHTSHIAICKSASLPDEKQAWTVVNGGGVTGFVLLPGDPGGLPE